MEAAAIKLTSTIRERDRWLHAKKVPVELRVPHAPTRPPFGVGAQYSLRRENGAGP